MLLWLLEQKDKALFDSRDDCATDAPPNHDLQATLAVNEAGVEGLHTCMSAVIDYMGCRITAQSIIPGILQVGTDMPRGRECARTVSPMNA